MPRERESAPGQGLRAGRLLRGGARLRALSRPRRRRRTALPDRPRRGAPLLLLSGWIFLAVASPGRRRSGRGDLDHRGRGDGAGQSDERLRPHRLGNLPGDVVEMGQELCVVEAMKMQNVIRSHKAGARVGKLHGEVGASLRADEILIEFDKLESAST